MCGISGYVVDVNANVCSTSTMSKKQRVGEYTSLGSSLPNVVGNSGRRNCSSNGQTEYSGTSLCQMQKCNLESKFTGNNTETSRTHVGVPVVSATTCSTNASSKRKHVGDHRYNANSL
ncbi:hypothetical protein Tco_0156801 [Tanacetum coccineum]